MQAWADICDELKESAKHPGSALSYLAMEDSDEYIDRVKREEREKIRKRKEGGSKSSPDQKASSSPESD